MGRNATVVDELIYYIGKGAQRSVFGMHYDDGKVVKVSTQITQNAIEFDIWASMQNYKRAAKWLAKCYSLSPNGKVLIQERLQPFSDVSDPRLPKKIPRCFTDLKVENWGVDRKGNVKCFDYGMTLLLQEKPWKLKKAKWWKATR